jgi:hypothetical protein
LGTDVESHPDGQERRVERGEDASPVFGRVRRGEPQDLTVEAQHVDALRTDRHYPTCEAR